MEMELNNFFCINQLFETSYKTCSFDNKTEMYFVLKCFYGVKFAAESPN